MCLFYNISNNSYIITEFNFFRLYILKHQTKGNYNKLKKEKEFHLMIKKNRAKELLNPH